VDEERNTYISKDLVTQLFPHFPFETICAKEKEKEKEEENRKKRDLLRSLTRLIIHIFFYGTV